MRQRLTLLVTDSIRSRRWCSAWFATCCSRAFLVAWFLGRHEALHLGEREGQKAQVLQELAPRGPGRGGIGNRLIMDAAAVSVAPEEDDEQGIDQQDIFYRMVFFLAAITPRPLRRVLGGRCAVRSRHGRPGDTDVAAGPAPTGADASSPV